jgi:invasion protein IalB
MPAPDKAPRQGRRSSAGGAAEGISLASQTIIPAQSQCAWTPVACDNLDILLIAPIQGRNAAAQGCSAITNTPNCAVDMAGRLGVEAGDTVIFRPRRIERIRLGFQPVENGTMGKFGRQLPRIASHLPFAFRALALGAVVTAGLLGFDTRASAQGKVRSVFNDWQIRCDTPPGAQAEQCALLQSVTAEDRPNIGLTVIILKTADKKSRIMRVIAPPGVLLPSGLGLKIDNTEVGRAGFVRCVPNGCVAEVVMDDNLINKLRTGQSATFIIFQTPEEGIGFPISLKGFGEGFDKLP